MKFIPEIAKVYEYIKQHAKLPSDHTIDPLGPQRMSGFQGFKLTITNARGETHTLEFETGIPTIMGRIDGRLGGGPTSADKFVDGFLEDYG